MNETDIKKCIKNGYCWSSYDDKPAKVRAKLYTRGQLLKIFTRLHATKAEARLAIAKRKARITAIVDGYIAKGGPMTKEQVTPELSEYLHNFGIKYSVMWPAQRHIAISSKVETFRFDKHNEYCEIKAIEEGRAFWREDDALHTKLLEDGKTQMTPITPEQAKMLRIDDAVFSTTMNIVHDRHIDERDVPHDIGLGVYYFTREAAQAALDKRKAPEETYETKVGDRWKLLAPGSLYNESVYEVVQDCDNTFRLINIDEGYWCSGMHNLQQVTACLKQGSALGDKFVRITEQSETSKQTEARFDVRLVSRGDSLIYTVKAIRSVIGCGLREARYEYFAKIPVFILRDVDEAAKNRAVAELEKVGAEVEVTLAEPTTVETPAQRDARIKALVDCYIAKGGPITKEQLTDEVRKGSFVYWTQYGSHGDKMKDIDCMSICVSIWPSDLNIRLGHAFWRESDAIHAKLLEDGKTQMTPITPEQAKMLSYLDEFYYISDGEILENDAGNTEQADDPTLLVEAGFSVYLNEPAAQAALDKRKAEDTAVKPKAPEETYETKVGDRWKLIAPLSIYNESVYEVVPDYDNTFRLVHNYGGCGIRGMHNLQQVAACLKQGSMTGGKFVRVTEQPETPEQRDARIKTLVDGYIAKGGPITKEQLTEEVWTYRARNKIPMYYAAQRAFWREDDAKHAKLLEDGKTQMTPITPEQAKGLRDGDLYFSPGTDTRDAIAYIWRADSGDMCLVRYGSAFFTKEAAIAKQQAASVVNNDLLNPTITSECIVDPEPPKWCERKKGEYAQETDSYTWSASVDINIGSASYSDASASNTWIYPTHTANSAVGIKVGRRAGDGTVLRARYPNPEHIKWEWRKAERVNDKTTPTEPAVPSVAKQESDGWTQEAIDKAAFKPSNKYVRTIHSASKDGETLEVDVYNVLEAFLDEDRGGAIGHAVKKLLCAGKRGHKDKAQDLREAICAIGRAITIIEQTDVWAREESETSHD